MKWPPESNLHLEGDTPSEIEAREKKYRKLRQDFAANPRGLGVRALGSTQTAQQFYDEREAAEAARRQLIADEAEELGPGYKDQFKPQSGEEPNFPAPPPATSEMITGVPEGLGATPSQGKLRSAPDMIEGVPGGVPDTQSPDDRAVANNVITGIPPEIK